MEVCLQRSLVDGGSKPRPAPPSVGADVCEVQKPLSLILTEAELGQRPQGHWVCECVCVCVCLLGFKCCIFTTIVSRSIVSRSW